MIVRILRSKVFFGYWYAKSEREADKPNSVPPH